VNKLNSSERAEVKYDILVPPGVNGSEATDEIDGSKFGAGVDGSKKVEGIDRDERMETVDGESNMSKTDEDKKEDDGEYGGEISSKR